MEIIYEDKKMLIVKKEAGKLSQSGKTFERDLTGDVLIYRKKKGEAPYAALINRLDRPVSGLVVFAKDKTEAARLSKLMQQGGFCKRYKAIVCGKPESDKGVFEDFLCKDEKLNMSRVADEKEAGAKYAKLEYEFVREIRIGQNIYSLVNIRLITGRHHQIRVQFAQRNMPLLGDVKYGGEKAVLDGENAAVSENIKLLPNEIALCAYSLMIDGKEYSTEQTWISE